ncbi:unnamed protein product [Boreogadus saida]
MRPEGLFVGRQLVVEMALRMRLCDCRLLGVWYLSEWERFSIASGYYTSSPLFYELYTTKAWTLVILLPYGVLKAEPVPPSQSVFRAKMEPRWLLWWLRPMGSRLGSGKAKIFRCD